MSHYLSGHPEIFMAKKEMHFFGQDLKFRGSLHRHNLDEYLDEFRDCNGQRRVGEASVWYLFSAQAASEIGAFTSDPRIIVMIRQPGEMLHSLYHQFRYHGDEHLPTFEAALNAEPERRAGHSIPRQACFLQGLVYRQTARYSEQIERYYNVFGRQRVHVIVYDDLATTPAKVYRDTLEFLEVDPNYVPRQFPIINGGDRTIRSAALRALMREPLLHRALTALRPYLPQNVLTALRNLERRLWQINTRSQKRSPLLRELSSKLKHEFVPEVQRLSMLLGRDLSHWSR
jgi:hypothetical protein